MAYELDPDGERLPIKIDSTTNGEFVPRPLEEHSVCANEMAQSWATINSSLLGMGRRQFLVSGCGAASTLLAFNHVHAAFGKTGSYYDVDKTANLDLELAEATLKNSEFIFDIQGHHINPVEAWRDPDSPWLKPYLMGSPTDGECVKKYDGKFAGFGHAECFTRNSFVQEIFMDSDTDVAVLTFVPTKHDVMPLTIDEAARTREIVNALDGTQRLLLHGRVIPNLPGDLQRMDELKESWNISAWKTYTQFGPTLDSGWWLDDEEFGAPLIQRARETGINLICIHKGLTLPPPLMGEKNREYSGCRDVGPAARQNPDINFIIYHSGYQAHSSEGPFVAGGSQVGIDSLIQSMLDSDFTSGENVYAELGSTWRNLMKDPDQAAHGIGKLLKYFGEDNVVWGTDSIWYGSPQDQIQAFRTFQISEEYREKYAYPKITPEIRAKIFGLNAAKLYDLQVPKLKAINENDALQKMKANYIERRDPSFLTYGPRTRREFLRFANLNRE